MQLTCDYNYNEIIIIILLYTIFDYLIINFFKNGVLRIDDNFLIALSILNGYTIF